MASYARPVKQVLRKSDCYFLRQRRGDHEFRFSPISGKGFPVDSNIKSRHTANAVLVQTGLPKAF